MMRRVWGLHVHAVAGKADPQLLPGCWSIQDKCVTKEDLRHEVWDKRFIESA